MVGGGALMIWAGFQGVPLVEVIKAVLSGTSLPTKSGRKKLDMDKLAETAPPVTAADDAEAQKWQAFGDGSQVGGSITTGSGETFYLG